MNCAYAAHFAFSVFSIDSEGENDEGQYFDR